jgi:hypothetical protein
MTVIWSYPTWDIFHVFTANIIKDTFDETCKNEMIELFTNICNTIPCMLCRNHASEYMKTINKDEIKTAIDLELFFWEFHNNVNQRSRKALFPQEHLSIYKRKNVKNVAKKFKQVLNLYYRNEFLLTQFDDFMKKNEHNFTYYEMASTPVITNANTNPKKESNAKPKKESNAKPKKESNAKPKKESNAKPKKESNANVNPKKNIFTLLFRKK